MLAVVKTPRIEVAMTGNGVEMEEFLALVRSRYSVSVIAEAKGDDDETVDAFETEFWKKTTPGDLLLGCRLKHGLTQEQLAEKTGIAQETLSAYETGKQKLSRRAAFRIGKALNEEPDDFFP